MKELHEFKYHSQWHLQMGRRENMTITEVV